MDVLNILLKTILFYLELLDGCIDVGLRGYRNCTGFVGAPCT